MALAIDRDYVRGFKDLDQFLRRNLKVSGEGAATHCARYLEQPSHVTSLRQDLLAKLQRLDDAQEAISSFEA